MENIYELYEFNMNTGKTKLIDIYYGDDTEVNESLNLLKSINKWEADTDEVIYYYEESEAEEED